ncbi:hypothetical protein P355_3558 [Burkholderia cenocepacia KC-01]|nr:hypothetical protein P355_3558 [Burkholderia cenocepacia KC-01]
MHRSLLLVRPRGRWVERPLLEIVRRSIKALHRKGPLRNRSESRGCRWLGGGRGVRFGAPSRDDGVPNV